MDAHLSKIETRDTRDRIMPDPNGYGIARADLVIEAVTEDPELKGKTYEDLSWKMKPEAILATNTKPAPRYTCPGGRRTRAICRPPFLQSKMHLIEVVRAEATSDLRSTCAPARCRPTPR